MRYRRLMVEGGTYFFTLVTFERAGIFHDPATAALFYQALNVVRREHPFVLDAHVVMPDHVHLLMTLPPDDSDFPTRLMLIKSGFTRRFTAGPSSSPESSLPEFRRASRRERRVWQGRYWEHLVGDQAEFDSYVDYIQWSRSSLSAPADQADLEWP